MTAAGYALARPLTEDAAAEHVCAAGFRAGRPHLLGFELEWLPRDQADPALPVGLPRLESAFGPLRDPGTLPAGGAVSFEPGGQVELSTAAAEAATLAAVPAAAEDLVVLRQAAAAAGLVLDGQGLDPLRGPRRLLDLPRYAAMEQYFDCGGPWGRRMMCSTAAVHVCADAGDAGGGPAGFRWRWRLLHAIGPVLAATFACSPLRDGKVTGWKSTRQLVWARLDPSRTRAPAGAEPWPGRRRSWPGAMDPREAWARYALDAPVMCVRRDPLAGWAAPPGMRFRDWLRGAGDRPATIEDLDYHLTTLFPPVRPRGRYLELRVIDAQPGDTWAVPVAVVSALLDDPAAGQAAMAAAEPVWASPARDARRRSSPWLRAARGGLADEQLGTAARACFEAAGGALQRRGAPRDVREAVAGYADRYVTRGRCPADDLLDQARACTRTRKE